jgi:septal ring factor EnvC (AmiA/AmiB activator)
MGKRTAVIPFFCKFFLIFIAVGLVGGFARAQGTPADSPLESAQPNPVARPEAPQQVPTVTTKQNLLQNKEGLADIKKKINEEKKKEKLDELKEKHVLNRIHRVDLTLHKLRKAKATNQVDLRLSEAKTARLQEAVQEKQEQLEQSRQMLAQRLRDLYRASFHHPILGGLLDAENFTDLARKLKFGIMLARSNEKLLARTLQDEDRLKKDSSQWIVEADRKQKMIKTIDRKEKNYDQEQKNHAVSLENIRKQKEQREKTIRELTESAKDLQNKVSQLLKEAAKAPKKKKVWISKSTASNTAAAVPVLEGNGLQVVRGRIPWPVSGKIISHFGRNKDPHFNLVVDNSGVQIQAPIGTPIHAVASGVVKFADWFKGYGKLVILDHGRGYYSLYAQAADLNVSEGQSVASGQVLGSVGDTDSLVGSSLYFEIRKNGIPQDPLHWLKYRN